MNITSLTTEHNKQTIKQMEQSIGNEINILMQSSKQLTR